MLGIFCVTVLPTCGLGIIAVGPFMLVMNGVTYLALVRNSG